MKRIILIFSILFFPIFTACEEEASVSDFLNRREIDSIFTDEEVELQTPIDIAQVQSSPFTAVIYGATNSGGTMTITFENEEGDVLMLTISNPANETYTAGDNSLNLFIGQVTYRESGEYYTTDPGIVSNSIGTLGLSINTAENTVSGTFQFTAYNSADTASIDVVSGNFEDIPIN